MKGIIQLLYSAIPYCAACTLPSCNFLTPTVFKLIPGSTDFPMDGLADREKDRYGESISVHCVSCGTLKTGQ